MRGYNPETDTSWPRWRDALRDARSRDQRCTVRRKRRGEWPYHGPWIVQPQESS